MTIILSVLAGFGAVAIIHFLLRRLLIWYRRGRGGRIVYKCVQDLIDDLSEIENKNLPVAVFEDGLTYFADGIVHNKPGKIAEHILIVSSTQRVNDIPPDTKFAGEGKE